MKSVDPIRDKNLLNDIDEYLRTKEVKSKSQEFIRDRNYLLFLFGVYEGRRITDILSIKVGDIQMDKINMIEKKTRKETKLHLHDNVVKAIHRYVKKWNLNRSDYLFQSRKKDPVTGLHKPLGRQGAYDFLKKDIQKHFGVQTGDIGTHTLRKTFGYMYYKQTGDVVMLQELFNHSDQAITKRYIGITDDEKRDAIKGFDPFK